jgi:hypothetical protein
MKRQYTIGAIMALEVRDLRLNFCSETEYGKKPVIEEF